VHTNDAWPRLERLDTERSLVAPAFDPPYESPIEEMFAWDFGKYCAETLDLRKQVSRQTRCGVFRVDFLAYLNGGFRVALECDGIAFHESLRDEWRDAILLGDDHVDAVVHMRGPDLFYHGNDVLYVLTRLYPELFSERGLVLLDRLASDAALKTMTWVSPGVAHVEYPEDEELDAPAADLWVVHRSRHMLRVASPTWRRYHDFATAAGGGNLVKLMEEYATRRTS